MDLEIVLAIAWFVSLVGVGCYMEQSAWKKGFHAGQGLLKSEIRGVNKAEGVIASWK